MIDFLIKSTICLSIFIVFYHLMLEREKMHRFNRFYLLSTIVISLVIPFITFEIIEIIPVVENLQSISLNSTPIIFKENSVKENVIPLQETINYTPYILWGIYWFVTLVLIVRFILNCLKLISKSKSNTTIKYKNANLVLVDEKTIPHTFLSFIYINFEDYNNRNIEDELYTHELVHVNQKHTLDILFIELLKVIFWFNPILIFYKKAIQLNHEFLADEEIVKTYNNVPFYQNLLLQKSSNIQTIYLASNLNYLVTKKRLIMMTKSTSRKIAILKKIAIIPILTVLVYFFCIEIVAQEKVITVKANTKNSKITDKDKIRDLYYSGVYVNLIDEKNNRKEVILYEDLSLEDKRKYLSFVPKQIVKNKISENLFEKMKKGNMAVWIDSKVKNKNEISKYNLADIAHYNSSFVHKNARSKRFPQEYQYSLYTKEYFDTNLKNSHTHFSGDTIKIVYVNYKTAIKKDITQKIKADTLEWYSKYKDGYNIYVNDHKRKKIILIDAGHGGKDFGTKINDEIESKIVESISKKIKLLNVKDEIEIVLLREDDSFIGLNERLKTINKINPDLLISLHINSSNNAEKNGIHAYVSKDNIHYKESLESANSLIDNISNEKLKKGEVNNASLFIIKNSNCPALALEIGYLSNNNDREYVTSEKGKNEIANRIYEVIKQF